MNKIYESISDTISRMKPFHKILSRSVVVPLYIHFYIIQKNQTEYNT